MGLFGKKKAAEGAAAVGVAAVAGAKKADGAAAADTELIAVIAAAISAYEAGQRRQALYIRKLNRASGARPAWGVMGTSEAIDSRRM